MIVAGIIVGIVIIGILIRILENEKSGDVSISVDEEDKEETRKETRKRLQAEIDARPPLPDTRRLISGNKFEILLSTGDVVYRIITDTVVTDPYTGDFNQMVEVTTPYNIIGLNNDHIVTWKIVGRVPKQYLIAKNREMVTYDNKIIEYESFWDKKYEEYVETENNKED